jgi:MoxR-like ATPase
MSKRDLFLSLAAATGKSVMSRQEIEDLCAEKGINFPQWFAKDPSNRASRGLYNIPNTNSVAMVATVTPMKKVDTPQTGNRIASVTTELETENLVPSVYKNYVPFGNYQDLLAIVQSNQFFPIFITGQSGNGKTMSVEQACAKAKRKFVCISMTPDTDESDLLGNYVLINGQMEWRDGPVTIAARQGAVLCIDEIDYGAQNLSCLQRVLEGKPFMLKKKGETVTPAPGFTIVATANTKGKGSDDGRYMFTNVLNEAFLERFLNTYEQEYPPTSVEKKIIKKELVAVGKEDDTFADMLVTWADTIRKTFAEGGVDEIISTRRLVHIVKTYGVHGDRMKAVSLCLNRFDDDTKMSFLDLYTKLDAEANKPAQPVEEIPAPIQPDVEIPF